MLQQMTITTEDLRLLEPLVRSGLEHEKQMLALGIERTRERLAEFETRFGMNSEEFARKLNALELDESVDFSDWRMEIGMLDLLERQYRTLRDARVN